MFNLHDYHIFFLVFIHPWPTSWRKELVKTSEPSVVATGEMWKTFSPQNCRHHWGRFMVLCLAVTLLARSRRLETRVDDRSHPFGTGTGTGTKLEQLVFMFRMPTTATVCNKRAGRDRDEHCSPIGLSLRFLWPEWSFVW